MAAAKSRYTLPEELTSRPRRRPARVADAVRNEISTLLLYKIKDPALAEVSIVKVVMSNDLKLAKISYSCPAEKAGKAKEGLNRAKGFIRSSLARVLQLRYAPDLAFYPDTSREYEEKMEKLFQEIAAEHESGSV